MPNETDSILNNVFGEEDGERLRAILSSPQPGGPPVQQDAVLAYCLGVPDSDEEEQFVRDCISKWKPWYDEYRHALFEADRVNAHIAHLWDTDHPSPDIEPSPSAHSSLESTAADTENSTSHSRLDDKKPKRRFLAQRNSLTVAAVAMAIFMIAAFWWFADSTDEIRDGRFIVAVQGNRIDGIENIPSSLSDTVRSLLLDQHRSVPESLASLQTRGGGSTIEDDWKPAGTALRASRPTFSWPEIKGVTAYRVILTQKDAASFESEPLRVPEWRPMTDLSPGLKYAWRVLMEMPDGTRRITPSLEESAPAFRILDANETEDLSRLEREASRRPLILLAAYLKYGMLEEAEIQLQQLKTHNEHSEIIQKIDDQLSAIRTMLR